MQILLMKGCHTQAVEVLHRLWGHHYSEVDLSSASLMPQQLQNSSHIHGKREDGSLQTLTEDEEQQGLLRNEDDGDATPPQLPVHHPTMSSVVGPTEPITILGLLRRKGLCHPVVIVALAMISQQGSGINAGMLLRFPRI